MNLVLDVILPIHVLFGFIAFFVAPAALITAKGGYAHRLWGKIYFWSMVVVAVTAIVASLVRPNYFLAFVSVFSFYLAFRGYRVLFRKRPREGEAARPMDWTGALAALVVSLALIVLGITQPGDVWVDLAPVAIAFGAIGTMLATIDLKGFVHPPTDSRHWWYTHMEGMIFSYVAAVSAFSVTNFHFLPVLVSWLWPSAVGIPLTVLWIRYYRRRMAG